MPTVCLVPGVVGEHRQQEKVPMSQEKKHFANPFFLKKSEFEPGSIKKHTFSCYFHAYCCEAWWIPWE